MHDQVRLIWRQRTGLQESLDILEVFDFVYGFLCHHIDGVDPDSFTDWVEESWLAGENPTYTVWSFFLQCTWLVLSPSDVLGLLRLTSLWRGQASNCAQPWSPQMKKDYLRARGFFNQGTTGRYMIIDVGLSPDTWYSGSDPEKACELQLQKMVKDRPSEVADVWAKYRTTLWQTDARGRFGQMQSARLLEFMASELSMGNQTSG